MNFNYNRIILCVDENEDEEEDEEGEDEEKEGEEEEAPRASAADKTADSYVTKDKTVWKKHQSDNIKL